MIHFKKTNVTVEEGIAKAFLVTGKVGDKVLISSAHRHNGQRAHLTITKVKDGKYYTRRGVLTGAEVIHMIKDGKPASKYPTVAFRLGGDDANVRGRGNNKVYKLLPLQDLKTAW